MKIHHLGIACSNIEEAIVGFTKYHTIVKQSEIVYDDLQNAHLCMVTTDMGLDFEFIAGEQVTRLVKKGISYYHVCYEVEDIITTINDFVAQGAMVVSDLKPAILFAGKRVAFLYVSYGLIELVEQ